MGVESKAGKMKARAMFCWLAVAVVERLWTVPTTSARLATPPPLH